MAATNARYTAALLGIVDITDTDALYDNTLPAALRRVNSRLGELFNHLGSCERQLGDHLDKAADYATSAGNQAANSQTSGDVKWLLHHAKQAAEGAEEIDRIFTEAGRLARLRKDLLG